MNVRRGAVLLLAFAGACATTLELPNALPAGRLIVALDDAEVVGPALVIPDLQSVRHVYVGELHTSVGHHAVQLEVARFLLESGSRIIIGVEWLPALVQPAVDAFLAGEIDEPTLLERTRWRENWGHDFAVYRAIFTWARREHVRIVGLNPPNELARAVARFGRTGVPAALRGQLPPLDTGNDAHRAYFLGRMKEADHAHGHGHNLDPARLERYYEAQLVRDETMAAGVARIAEEAPDAVVVVFAGLGHIDFGLGVPARAAKALGDYRIVLPIESDALPSISTEIDVRPYPARRADYAWEAPRPGGVLAQTNFSHLLGPL